jgi:hypothetical protein
LDASWLKKMKNAAEYHEALPQHFGKMLDAHFAEP